MRHFLKTEYHQRWTHLCLLVIFELLLISFSQNSWGQPAEDLLYENQAYEIQTPTLSFFNHNTIRFDRDEMTKEATHHAMQFSKNNNIPVFLNTHMTTQPSGRDEYFVDYKKTDYIHISESGAHNIKFKNLETIYFTGGFVSFCLCEAIRDVLRRVEFSKDPLNIVLFTDAIYMAQNTILSGKFDPKTHYDIPLPYITPEEYSRIEKVETYVFQLSEYIEKVSDEAVLGLFKSYVFNTDENQFCTNQQTNQFFGETPLPLTDYSFDFYLGDEPIGIIGNGPKRSRIYLKTVNESLTPLTPSWGISN